MNCATLQTASLIRPSLLARALAAFARLLRAIASVLTGRAPARAVDRVAAEHEALGSLSEHVLRDIGASPRLIANAAECARSSLDAAYERRFY
jgi:uncharacterized protein YjiS (DUF1127 family)